jgi:hypothetical protein
VNPVQFVYLVDDEAFLKGHRLWIHVGRAEEFERLLPEDRIRLARERMQDVNRWHGVPPRRRLS